MTCAPRANGPFTLSQTWQWIAMFVFPLSLCECTAIWDLQSLQGAALASNSGLVSGDGGDSDPLADAQDDAPQLTASQASRATPEGDDESPDTGGPGKYDASVYSADASPGQPSVPTPSNPPLADASTSPTDSNAGIDRASTDVASAPPIDASSGLAPDAPTIGTPDPGSGTGRCNPGTPWGAPAEVSSLQSSTREAGLHLTANELTGFFWEGPLGATSLYSVTRTNTMQSFGNPTLLNNVNIGVAQYDPSTSGDGLTLFFRSAAAGGSGGDHIYWASRASVQSDFSNVNLAANLNSSSNDVQPYLVPNASEIYFSSDRTGDYDIYSATGSGGVFGAPAAVGQVNETGVDDQNPTVSADGLEIWFSSTRSGGQGGQDVWTALRADAGSPFGAPTLVTQVNSTGNDYPSWVSADLCRLYLYSDRTGTLHVYLATRAP